MSLICYLTKVHFADRVLEDALAEELSRHRITRPLIVTDEESAEGDEVDRLVCTLPPEIDPIFFFARQASGARSDPLRAEQVLFEADCDGIVGFGGMEALDLARLVGGRRRSGSARWVGMRTCRRGIKRGCRRPFSAMRR